MKINIATLRKLILKEMQAVPKIPTKPEFGTMDIKGAIIEDAIDDYHSSQMSKAEVIIGLADQYSMSVGEIESILATDDRWNMLAETKYTMSKTKIRQIIKEEKDRLLSEMNPDGTISDDEDAQREAFLVEVEDQAEELVRFIQMEAERIGGDFRSPGIRKQAYMLVAELIHGLR